MTFVRLIGRRAFWSFFLVTLLIVGVLAATNIVSKYAIKMYTEDQLRQLPWDAVLYQSEELPHFTDIRQRVTQVEGVKRVESLGILRVRLTPQMPIDIDGTPVFIPWLSIVSATNPNILPPELRPESGTLLAMLGPQKVIKPYLDHISKGSTLTVKLRNNDPQTDHQSSDRPGLEIFAAELGGVTQVDRLELVKWIMREVGSATFVPELGLIVVLPMERFEREVARLDTLLRQQDYSGLEEEEGRAVKQMGVTYTPEIDHLIALDRSQLFSGWDLEGSTDRVSVVIDKIRTVSEDVDFDVVTNSDLFLTVEKVLKSSKLIGLVSILISLPILWMAWTFAASLAGLVVLNERRLIGLLRLRGASSHAIDRAFIVAIGSGGVIGGLVGVIAGTFLPLEAYHLFSGSDVPFSLVHKIQEPWSLVLFIVVASTMSLLAGKKVTDYVTGMTPRENSARVASSEAEALSFHFTRFQLLALVLGSYKVITWIIDYSPPSGVLSDADHFLSFVAVPLFIYGFVSFIVSRSSLAERFLRRLAGPFAGDLEWFAVRNMMMRPHRVLSAIMIAAMMFSISLYPKVTSDSFYDKTERAVRENTGSDLALVFDASEMTDGDIRAESVSSNLSRMGPKVEAIIKQVKGVGGIKSTACLYEFTTPGSFYVRGQTSVPLYVLQNPEDYLRAVYYEKELGQDKPFDATINQVHEGVVVSRGLVNVGGLSLGDRFGLGRGGTDGGIKETVSGVVNALPGAPDLMMQNREAYLGADIEFINYIGRTNAFTVGTGERLKQLEALASRFVLLINTDDPAAPLNVKRRIEALPLPAKIAYVKSISEETQRLSKDMFVSLALENLAVYMVGGILVAFAGIIAISIANFMEAKRTFALLRMRGASPKWLLRLLIADFFVPVLCGMIFGVFIGILAGYGMTTELFKIPRVLSILEILPVHLVLSPAVFAIIGALALLFAAAAVSFSLWIFRRTARETLAGG